MKKSIVTKSAALMLLLVALLGLQACNQKSGTGSKSKASDSVRVESLKLRLSPLSSAQLVYIPYAKIEEAATKIDDYSKIDNYSLLRVLHNDSVLPIQHIDKDGDARKDGLLVHLNEASTSEILLALNLDASLPLPPLEKKTQAEISVKENGTWVQHPNAKDKQAYQGGAFLNVGEVSPPDFYTDHSNWIRYEGPGIESDLVGYRIYLDWRNGFDIFGKKVSAPVLQQVGLDGYESYHAMADWGMDILKVGSSLGAGGFGYWDGEKINLPSDVENRHAKIVENGDLYSAFSIEYRNWKLPNLTTTLTAQFAMAANSRLVHTELASSERIANFAIGVVKHENTQLLTGNLQGGTTGFAYLASWGKQSLSGDNLGMAVIFPVSQYQQTLEVDHSYAVLMNADESTLGYYFLAAWEGEHNNGIASAEAFESYLKEEIGRLNANPQITVSVQ